MSALVRLTDDRLAYLEQQLKRAIPAPELTAGWDYFRGRRVFGTEVVDGNTVYGAVNGSRVYAVMLDTDDFAFSTCTCGASGGCRHMAAVYYHYARMIGQEAEAVRERTMAASETAVAGESDRPGPKDGPEAWMSWFQKSDGEMWKICRHSLHPLQPVISRLKGTAREWPRSMQRMHWLHVFAFVLEQVEKAYAATDAYNRYYYEMSYNRSVEPWMSSFEEMLGELVPERFSEDERTWAASLSAALLGAALNPAFTLLRWDLMHHRLWERLAGDPGWRQAGRESLERLLKEASSPGKTRGTLLAALAQLDVLEGRDREAVDRLKEVEFERVAGTVYAYAERRLDRDEPDAAALWLEFLYDCLKESRNGHILRPFLLICRRADAARPGAGWSERMVSLLPHSYSELSAHWLERGRYGEWCDLQLLMGKRPDELDVHVVRSVARSAPGELLPLFHVAIDESVSQRNRQGYRAAVNLLKKLEKLYGAIGRQEVWSRYIGQFVRKYHRMRALQEELWRAKIVE